MQSIIQTCNVNRYHQIKNGQYGCYHVTSKREQLHEKMKRHAHARMKYFHIIINGGVWV